MKDEISALHVRFEGLTSSFRYPLTISGVQASTPVPSYNTILGMLGACAGRIISPKDTRMGFEFRTQSFDTELERTVRWKVDKGNLRIHDKGQGISLRQFYWRPVMNIYLTNLNLKKFLENPVATPSFGRSQDICWIPFVKEVKLSSIANGKIGATLIPFKTPKKKSVPGLVVSLPEYIENKKEGFTRRPKKFNTYLAMDSTEKKRYEIECDNLYNPSDLSQEEVIYLHNWAEDE